MEGERAVFVFVRNAKGCLVRKCCGTCAKRILGYKGHISCKKDNMYINDMDLCEDWVMSRAKRRHINKPGKVKSKDYLMFVQRIRLQEVKDIEEGKMKLKDMASNPSLRKRYEAETGLSPYLIK